jgi:hypothetical protein
MTSSVCELPVVTARGGYLEPNWTYGFGNPLRSHKLESTSQWYSCRCFTAMPTKGYSRGGEFVGRVSPRSGTQSCKEHKV